MTKSKLLLVSLLSLIALSGCMQGPKGDTGSAGSGRIVQTINCSGTILGLAGNAGTSLNGLEVEYDAVINAAGDVYATGRIIDSATQTTSTHFYSAGQAGSNFASVLIVADYDLGPDDGFWQVSLNRTTMITSITYVDSSLGIESPVNMTFTPGECIAQNW